MSNPEEKIVKIIDNNVPSRSVSVEQVGSLGAMAVTMVSADSSNLPGMEVPACDSVVVSYPTDTTEVYTYKTGGVSGTTVATVTVTYTTNAKTVLTSVVKTLP